MNGPVSVACIACGANSTYRGARDGQGSPIARCPKCGLGTLVDQPSPGEASLLYSSGLYAPGSPRAAWLVGLAHRMISSLRLRLLPSPPHGRLLDVGSGKGHFLASARRAGWDATGVEVSGSAVEEGIRRYGAHAVVGDWSDVRLEGEFDVISMWHVLEHLPDPADALRLAHGRIAPGGSLVISVPNSDSLQARLFGDAWFHLDLPRHLYHFTPEALARLLERTGFEIVHTDTFAPDMDVMGFIASVQNRLGLEPNLAIRFVKRDAAVRSTPRVLASLGLALLSTPVGVLLGLAAPLVGRGASLQIVARPVARAGLDDGRLPELVGVSDPAGRRPQGSSAA